MAHFRKKENDKLSGTMNEEELNQLLERAGYGQLISSMAEDRKRILAQDILANPGQHGLGPSGAPIETGSPRIRLQDFLEPEEQPEIRQGRPGFMDFLKGVLGGSPATTDKPITGFPGLEGVQEALTVPNVGVGPGLPTQPAEPVQAGVVTGEPERVNVAPQQPPATQPDQPATAGGGQSLEELLNRTIGSHDMLSSAFQAQPQSPEALQVGQPDTSQLPQGEEVDPGQLAPPEMSALGKIGAFLSNPAVIKGLAQFGAAISPEGTPGQALGQMAMSGANARITQQAVEQLREGENVEDLEVGGLDQETLASALGIRQQEQERGLAQQEIDVRKEALDVQREANRMRGMTSYAQQLAKNRLETLDRASDVRSDTGMMKMLDREILLGESFINEHFDRINAQLGVSNFAQLRSAVAGDVINPDEVLAVLPPEAQEKYRMSMDAATNYLAENPRASIFKAAEVGRRAAGMSGGPQVVTDPNTLLSPNAQAGVYKYEGAPFETKNGVLKPGAIITVGLNGEKRVTNPNQ